ncbi:uncharacterized protein LOC135461685 [Liolophura sinensis]|uniref:uncharacterized protein LOC135461685 n=1 Tax=Liolophura sinensis TaxID=3198878 RepID=UPI003159100B
MPKAETDQEQVESTTGADSQEVPKPDPTKVVDLTTEKVPAPTDAAEADQSSNGISSSLKRKSTGETECSDTRGEKARRLSVEEVPAEGAATENVSDPEASSDVPQGEAGEFEKVPPWEYSDVHPNEIGWRMGELEQYKFDFWDWFMTLSDSEQEKFKETYPPPEDWAGFYDNQENDSDENEDGSQ